MQKAKGAIPLSVSRGESRVLADGTYDFEFNIDPGHYCLIAEYIDGNGDKITSGNSLTVEGKLYPNQFFGGCSASLFGLLPLRLSAQSTARARKSSKGKRNHRIEGLSEASQARIAAGPAGAHPCRALWPPGPTCCRPLPRLFRGHRPRPPRPPGTPAARGRRTNRLPHRQKERLSR